MKKLIRGMLLMVFLLALTAVPAFAGTDTYPYLTFQDSEDFTIVNPQISYDQIRAMGLDSSFTKQEISDPQNITWTSSNPSVALVVPNSGQYVYVVFLNEGTATVTASYTCADNTVITCPANVVVERRNNPVNLVQGVNVTIVGDPNGSGIDISRTSQDPDGAVDVPLFELTDIWPSINDDDVLKMDPSALHAVLYTLELKMDDDAYVWGDPGWDWDWVPDYVTIDYQGSYIAVIDGDQYGWTYEYNGAQSDKAISIIKLSTGDSVDLSFN